MDYSYGHCRGGGGGGRTRKDKGGWRGGRNGGRGGGGGIDWNIKKRKPEEDAWRQAQGGGKRNMGGIPKSRQPGYDNRGGPLSLAAAAGVAAEFAPPPSQPPPPPDTSESSLLYSFDEEEEQEQEHSQPMEPMVQLLPVDIQYTLHLLQALAELPVPREEDRLYVELLGMHEYRDQAHAFPSSFRHPSSLNEEMYDRKWNTLASFVQSATQTYRYGRAGPSTHPMELKNAYGRRLDMVKPRAAFLLHASSTQVFPAPVTRPAWPVHAGCLIINLRLDGPLPKPVEEKGDDGEKEEGQGAEEGKVRGRGRQRTLVVQMFYVLEGERMEEVERNALRLVMGLALALRADYVSFIQRMQVHDKRRHAVWRERYGARVLELDKQQGMEIRFNVHAMRALLKREK